MKVTYIGHSGFMVETEIANLLFDYCEGVLPEVDCEKPFVVFVSHAHSDHYNPEIFALAKKYKNIQYVLSHDIRLTEELAKEYKMTRVFIMNRVISVQQGIRRVIPLSDAWGGDYIVMETIKSTDQGVAFLLNVGGKRIYHAGDLNCWVWEDDTKQEFNNMSALFKRAVERINGREIHLAFAPLDPRQGKYYKLGMEYLLNAAPITYAVPMHFWQQPEIMDRYEEERQTKDLATTIVKLRQGGDTIELT